MPIVFSCRCAAPPSADLSQIHKHTQHITGDFKLAAHIYHSEYASVPSTSGSTRTSQAALQSPDVQVQPPDDQEESTSDHQYALDLIDVKQKLTEAQERVDELQRKLRNSRDRERRHTKTMKSLLQDLKEKNLLTEELQHKLDSYSDLPVELFKKDCVFTQAQREFSLTLHLHGPKAYKYLRETMKIPLPHPHTLQSALNKSVIGCVRVFYN
ncbi:hypothetical protein ABVT39_008906 [Epinephelus coioides]